MNPILINIIALIIKPIRPEWAAVILNIKVHITNTETPLSNPAIALLELALFQTNAPTVGTNTCAVPLNAIIPICTNKPGKLTNMMYAIAEKKTIAQRPINTSLRSDILGLIYFLCTSIE